MCGRDDMPKVYVSYLSSKLEIDVILFATIKLKLCPNSAPNNESRARSGELQW